MRMDDVKARRFRTRARVVARLQAVLEADVARRLEKHLWAWAWETCERDDIPQYWENPAFRYRYTTRALSLEFNLKNPKNPGLVEGLRDGTIPLETFVGMTPQEMWPEPWKAVEERVKARQLRREAASLDPATAPDGAYTCSKCKSKKTVYTQIQIRAADEPATIFVRCINCGKAWKN